MDPSPEAESGQHLLKAKRISRELVGETVVSPRFRPVDASSSSVRLRDHSRKSSLAIEEALMMRATKAKSQFRNSVETVCGWRPAWGLLAWLLDQPAACEVGFLLQQLPSLPVRLPLADEVDITAAAKLKATRRISFADGFAVALAQREKAILVTGDPELHKMTGAVGIHWIGSANASLS